MSTGVNLIDQITRLQEPSSVVSGLAVEFWWLAHDEWGAARLGSSATGGAMGIGLAAALLGDLVVSGRLGIRRDGTIGVLTRDGRPDPLAGHVFAQIRNSAPYRLQEWLPALAVDAHSLVAARLEADGLVRSVEVRRRCWWCPWRHRVDVLYPSTNHLAAAQPAVVLSRRLARGEPMGHHDALLLAIAGATGLGPLLVQEGGPDVDRNAPFELGGLTGISRDLALTTRTVLTRAVLTHRS